jgi:uncharacterized membrane protein YfcA
LPRRLFDTIFGLLLIAAAVYLGVKPRVEVKSRWPCPPNYRECIITDASGTVHRFSYHQILGVTVSMVVGFFSSLLGIGGGIIHVPVLVQLLNFPIHIATATSHFVLTNMALAGTLTHIVTGTFTRGFRRTLMVAIGVILGAQLGAWLSGRTRGTWIIRGLAIALGAVGIRLLVTLF